MSDEVAAILGTRGVKGIGSALSGTRLSLEQEGIRLEEAVKKRSVRGRTVWTPGPRILQAQHILKCTKRYWTRHDRDNSASVDEAPSGHVGPLLVLRALISKGDIYAVDGSLTELDGILNDEMFEIQGQFETIGEIFIGRIEPGPDGVKIPIPEGYEENGIWIRGRHDYARPHVSGAIGTGRHPKLTAWIGEATWVERRVVLVDAVRQMEKVRGEGELLPRKLKRRWRDVDENQHYRYVRWISTRWPTRTYNAPPLRMRLRCWYEIIIETSDSKRVVLHEEGLRGGEARIATRAIDRWRNTRANRSNELVAVREIRIAKKQPRPFPPIRQSLHTGGHR